MEGYKDEEKKVAADRRSSVGCYFGNRHCLTGHVQRIGEPADSQCIGLGSAYAVAGMALVDL